jgi:tetratricopeptide (TPR) repeat protein
MSHLELNELVQVEKLFDEFRLDEAIELLDDLVLRERNNIQQKVSYQVLKSYILVYQGKVKELFKVGRNICKESQKSNAPLQSVDGLSLIFLGLILFNRFDEALEVIQKAEDLLKSIPQLSQKELLPRKVRITVSKGLFNFFKGNIELAEKYFERTIESQKEIGINMEILWAYLQMAAIRGNMQSRFDLGLEYTNKALSIAKKMKFNHYWIAMCYNGIGGIYSELGEFDLSLEHFMQSLQLFEKIKNNGWVATLKSNIGYINADIGNYDIALKYLEEALIIWEQNPIRIEFCISNLLFIALEKGDSERAQKYFHRLEDMYNKSKDSDLEIMYQYFKAKMLRRSSRIRDTAEAEELLKQLLQKKPTRFNITIDAYIELCDLLLSEYRINKNAEVFDEINQNIAQLLILAEKSHSYLIFCETFILQAKLALLDLDIKGARRYLTQAQKIAESYGIKRLAMKISYEHDELLKQLEIWEKFKESKAPLEERMELSRLNEQMEGMVRKRLVKVPKLEAEQPVLLTIMSKKGNVLLSNPFTADVKIDSAFFSEFLSSCNTFCDQILSESFDRVKFGQHTVLITAIDSFSICYMFQGQSYSARQKLLHFSEAVKKEPDIMKILENTDSKNIEIKVHETASLEELIYESFLSDPQQFQMPFTAYDGDEPFVFVSYSHIDRLQVYPIIDYLNKTGMNIWYDEGIPISEDWKESIVENLERCSAFVVFITPHIIDSEYVRKEISFALKKKKPFFSIYLKETELPSKLEFEIGDIQFMNKYLMPETEFYNKLNKMLDPVLNK